MDFSHKIPEWKNGGVEPSESLKQNGFVGGYKPAAAVFNWFFAKFRNAITELQSKLSTASDKLDGIEDNANNYTLPAATTGSLGGIKISSPFSIGTDGALKASPASESTAGLMTTAQFTKLNGIATGANKTTVDSSLSDSSTNPVQNKVVYAALDKKVEKIAGKGLSTWDYNDNDKNKVLSIGAYNTKRAGYSPTALGEETTATGNYAVATGYKTSAYGYCSFASGSSQQKAENIIGELLKLSDWTDADIVNAHKSAPFSLAFRDNSRSEGESCLALGHNTHAEGKQTIAVGQGSHSEGCFTQAQGYASYAAGYKTYADARQFVVGRLNSQVGGAALNDSSDSDAMFLVGCGLETNEGTITKANGFRVSSSSKCYGSNAFIASGADYAEYVEWLDGNPNGEDRRGKFVTLDGDKIRFANSNDEFILGVVSGSGSFIGNSQSEEWKDKYLVDVFGARLTQEVEIPETTDEETGEIIPAHTVTQFIVNPEYDSEKEYTSREFRKEWSAVGMLGFVTVIDDGTCQVNGYCKPSDNGVATASETGYRVVNRIDNSHIKVFIK